ncbi:MAG: hypothetical protein E7641_09085, partial [Ruminococcaceae bacterium]|nr:hypothetical protein [Oscillospiraceae bacterium]
MRIIFPERIKRSKEKLPTLQDLRVVRLKMRSVKNIYKIGIGPSSSHTMGPAFAAKSFIEEYPDCERIQVTLYGSLAKTGKGHGTDRAIIEVLSPIETDIIFNLDESISLEHPNTMTIEGYKGGERVAEITFLSIGGGEIRIKGEAAKSEKVADLYFENSFSEIAAICKDRNIRLSDYVFEHEAPDFRDFLGNVWHTMQAAIRDGLSRTGELPGGLGVKRKAQKLFNQRHIDESPQTKENRLVCAYAFAVSEQNADCGLIVTAPTCGSCGVLPAVLKYMQDKNSFSDDDVIRA